MSSGLVLVTHANLGRALLQQVEMMLGPFPGAQRVIGVLPADDPDRTRGEIEAATAAVDAGEGVLLLTDVFGATPSNLAHQCVAGPARAIVHGLNLPMLLKAHTYAALPLEALVEKIIDGGRAAIFGGDPP